MDATRMAMKGLSLAAVISAVGCDDSELQRRSNELVAPIELAIENPTGTVGADSAQRLLTRLYGGDADSAALSEIAVSTTDVASACLRGLGTEDDPQEIDMECASDGLVTGTVIRMSETDGDDTYTLLTYEDTCLSGQDFCIDGVGAYVVTLSDDGWSWIELQGNDVEVRRGGRVEREIFGTALTETRAGSVFMVDGESFVVGAAASIDLEGESTLTLVGENGAFDCAFTDRGEQGECSGAGSFAWP